MKRLVRQLMCTSVLIVSLALLPLGLAQAATRAPSRPVRPTVPGTTYYGISATVCQSFIGPDNEVFYAYTGTDSHLNIVDQSHNSAGGPFDFTITYTDTSQSAPGITCWNHKVWIVFRANDSSNAIHVGDATDATDASGGLQQLAHGNTIPGQTVSGPPAIGANGGTLYVAWKGSNNTNMTVEESVTGTSWFDRTVITGNTTSNEPTLTTYGGNLILAWAGTDFPAHVNFATYHDGNPTLANKVKTSGTTAGEVQKTIGVSVYNSRIQLAFEESGSSGSIFTGSWSSTTGYISNGQLNGVVTTTGIGLAGLNVYTENELDLSITETQMPG